MKEKPIPFSGPMVRAILDGRKTQTRRVIKDARGAFWDHAGYRPVVADGRIVGWQPIDGGNMIEEGSPRPLCRYGPPGTLLWVRETFSISAHGPFYKADDRQDGTVRIAWSSSIHMPRRYSRITLRVKSVRVERVQDITEEDARAEGFESRDAFFNLFYDVNKRAPRTENPLVWVIEFERVKP